MAQKWYQKSSVQTAITSGVFFLIGIAIPLFLKIPALKSKIDRLEKENSDKTNEIQRLETQLTPFKTIALEKYTGSEQEALEKLAEDVKTLEEKALFIEKALMPRVLSSEQISIIAERINKIKNTKIHFLLIASDPEAESFRNQLRKALEKGGWTIEKSETSVIGAFVGVTLFASHDPPNEAVTALYLSLKEFGFDPWLLKDENLPENVIGIKIGKKK